MVKLTEHGVYLVDGKVAKSADLSPAEARKTPLLTLSCRHTTRQIRWSS